MLSNSKGISTTNNAAAALVPLGWWLHAAGLSLTAAIAFGAWFAVDHFVDRHLDRLERQRRAAARFVNTEADVLAEHRQLKHEFIELSSQFEQLVARIPSEARESDFLSQVSDLAEQCSLAIRDYQPGTAVNQEGHCELDVAMSAEGSYQAICQFLTGVHTLPRLSRITRLHVASGATPTADAYPLEMTLRIYHASLQRDTQHE